MVFIWEMDLLSFNDAITLPLFNRRGTLQASGGGGGLGGLGAGSTDGLGNLVLWAWSEVRWRCQVRAAVPGFAWTSRAGQDQSQAVARAAGLSLAS